jgi:hypothetical protein
VQYGKPTTATYDFAEKMLHTRMKELHGASVGSNSQLRLSVTFPPLLDCRSLNVPRLSYMIGGKPVGVFLPYICISCPSSESDNPESGIQSLASMLAYALNNNPPWATPPIIIQTLRAQMQQVGRQSSCTLVYTTQRMDHRLINQLMRWKMSKLLYNGR